MPQRGAQTSRLVLLSGDIVQEELRIAAHYAGGAMRDELLSGADVHSNTARIVYEKAEGEEVKRGERQHAKTVNFGILYECSPGKLGELCPWLRACRRHPSGKSTCGECVSGQRLDDVYHRLRQRWEGLTSWQAEARAGARRLGYAATLLGRRYYIAEYTSGDERVAARGDRIATNHPIQGTGADIIKVAMVHLAEAARGLLSGSIRIQVHDDLVIVCPLVEVPAWAMLIQQAVDHAVSYVGLSLPLPVEYKVGLNWGQMKHWVPGQPLPRLYEKRRPTTNDKSTGTSATGAAKLAPGGR